MVREREEIIYMNMIKVSRYMQDFGWYNCGYLAYGGHVWWSLAIAGIWVAGWSSYEDRLIKAKEEMVRNESK